MRHVIRAEVQAQAADPAPSESRSWLGAMTSVCSDLASEDAGAKIRPVTVKTGDLSNDRAFHTLYCKVWIDRMEGIVLCHLAAHLQIVHAWPAL
jgi:hypothetical protein